MTHAQPRPPLSRPPAPSPTVAVAAGDYAAAYEALLAALRAAPERIHDAHARDEWALIRAYGWAIPNTEALAALVELGPLIEVGAGVGLWARLLRDAGADVVATDRRPRRRTWTPIAAGGASRVAVAHPNRALLLVWPPDSGRMAAVALRAYRGDRLAYVGERAEQIVGPMFGRTRSPATGDSRFHTLLAREWELVRRVEIPNRLPYEDDLTIYRRRRRPQ